MSHALRGGIYKDEERLCPKPGGGKGGGGGGSFRGPIICSVDLLDRSYFFVICSNKSSSASLLFNSALNTIFLF